MRALYLASSYGLGALIMQEMGCETVGADIDSDNATSLPFKNDEFGLVISRDFLARDYHLLTREDRNKIAEEIHRVLAVNGHAIFYTLYSKAFKDIFPPDIKEGLPPMGTLLEKFKKTQIIQVYYSLDLPTHLCIFSLIFSPLGINNPFPYNYILFGMRSKR